MQLWHSIDTHKTPSSLISTQDKNLYSKSSINKRHEQLSMDYRITNMEGFIYCIIKVASHFPHSESDNAPKLPAFKGLQTHQWPNTWFNRLFVKSNTESKCPSMHLIHLTCSSFDSQTSRLAQGPRLTFHLVDIYLQLLDIFLSACDL